MPSIRFIFHHRKNMNIGSSSKTLRTMVISEKQMSSAICWTTGTLKSCFILSVIGFISHHEWIYFLPLNYTRLSKEWGMISFYHCIYFALTANQKTRSLKSLAVFYGYVWPSRQISGL